MALLKIQDPDFNNLDSNLKNDIKNSILEGSFGTIMGTLVGGAFLNGFALALGADNFIIGILASLPLLANLIQVIGSYIINKSGDSKKLCITFLFIHRIFWVFIILLPLFLFNTAFLDFRIWIFILLLGTASIFASLTSISWLTWMADLIPTNLRGRFFAKRNMIAQMAGMVFAVLAGNFIDTWKTIFPDNTIQTYGFTILFAIGTIAGLICIYLLKRMNPPDIKKKNTNDFLSQLKLPLLDSNFKFFIIFSVIWGFSVGIAGPFFSVYMIDTLFIPFSIISLFGVAAGLSSILGMRLLGKMTDFLGPKPLYMFCGLGASILPFLWIFASPYNYSIIWLINIISGFCWAGIGLASSSMIMNLAPSEHNSVYFAVFAAITGLSGALAPILGGFLGKIFQGVNLSFGFISISNLRILFLISCISRFLSLLLLKPIHLKENMTIKEIFNNYKSLSLSFPQNMYFSITSYIGNLNKVMNRGIINIERNVEKILASGKNITYLFNYRIKIINDTIDKRYEDSLDIIV
ncbi:MAG: MFS transporter, partial [Bacillota bacterium]